MTVARRRISILTVGGTIVSALDPSLGGAVPSDAAALFAAAGAEHGDIIIAQQPFASVSSFQLDLAGLATLCDRLDRLVADPLVDGIVVTHGTDTMEESVFAASLCLAWRKPVVFTGAQRAMDAPRPDGPTNLSQAIRVAAEPAFGSHGPVICFAGQVFSARSVVKQNTLALHGFAARDGHVLAEAAGAHPACPAQPPAEPLYRARRAPAARVDILTMALGCAADLVAMAVEAGAAGLVIEAFGTGNVPPAVALAIEPVVAAGIPVAITSRCAAGPVRAIYAGAGGAVGLRATGCLFAGDLGAPKARLLLSAMLTDGQTPAAIRAVFDRLDRESQG
jgi:L-asparaginase